MGTVNGGPLDGNFHAPTPIVGQLRRARAVFTLEMVCSSGLDHGSARVSSASGLRNGVFTLTPKSGFLQAARSRDQIKGLIAAAPMSAALGRRAGIRWADQKAVCV